MATVKAQGAAPQAPKAEILDLKIQLVSEGHHKHVLAQTDMSSFNVHCYAPKGGENGMHAHMEEDHVFLVLQGEAQFVTPEAALALVEGLLRPPVPVDRLAGRPPDRRTV